jgi:hypothetical protein
LLRLGEKPQVFLLRVEISPKIPDLPGAGNSKKVVGLIGVIMVPFLALGMIVSFLIAMLPGRTPLEEIAIFLAGLWLLAAPFLVLAGSALCIIRLCYTARPTWAETCALFVYMVILSFLGFGLYTGISFANLRAHQRTASQEKSGQLLGKFDSAAGRYVSSDGKFELKSDYFKKAEITDKIDSRNKLATVSVSSKIKPLWTIETLPVTETGASADISPGAFVDKMLSEIKPDEVISTERRMAKPGGESLRISFQIPRAGKPPVVTLIDNICIDGTWYKVGAAAATSGSPKLDAEVLAKSLDEFWESITILKTEGMPPSSSKNENQLVKGEETDHAFHGPAWIEQGAKISTLKYGDFSFHYIEGPKDVGGTIQEEDVRKLADFLAKVGFLSGQQGSLTLERSSETIVIQGQVSDEARKDPSLEHHVRLWLSGLRNAGFGGRRVIWKTRDSKGEILATFTDAGAFSMTKSGTCTVFYTEGDAELETEAAQMAEWVSGSLMGMNPMQFLLVRGEDGVRRITIYGSPGAEQVAEYVSDFRVGLQGIKKAVFGEKPIQVAIGTFLFRPVALLELDRSTPPQSLPADWPRTGPWNSSEGGKPPGQTELPESR